MPRIRALPRYSVDRAFEEAVAIVMSVEASNQGRKVRCGAEKGEIV